MDDPEEFLRQKKESVTESIDPKKWVWIEDKAEGYLSAKILEVNGETLSVETKIGQVMELIRKIQFCISVYHHLSCRSLIFPPIIFRI